MNLHKLFTGLFLAMFVALGVFGVEMVNEAQVAQASISLPSTSGVAGGTDQVISYGADETGADTLVDRMYKFAATLAWIVLGISVIMIVYAGFKYATSQGDPKATESAKMQIVSAGVGIAIAMLAFVILQVFTSIIGG